MRSLGFVLIGILLGVFLAGCASPPEYVAESIAPKPLREDVVEWSGPGLVPYGVTAQSIRSTYGCTVAYEQYSPKTPASRTAVILGHGFMRNLAQTRGWARLWASRGITVVIPSLCNSTWLDGHHDRNARDMVALADRVVDMGVADRIIYAGHSAGGLAALLAAHEDPRAVAYLGLDSVDSGGLTATIRDASRKYEVPSLILVADPSGCNADNNILPVLPDSASISVVRIPFSRHCDFEKPYDPQCALLCGTVEPLEVAKRVRDTVEVLATAWIELHAGAPERRASVREAIPEVVRTLRRNGNLRVLE